MKKLTEPFDEAAAAVTLAVKLLFAAALALAALMIWMSAAHSGNEQSSKIREIADIGGPVRS